MVHRKQIIIMSFFKRILLIEKDKRLFLKEKCSYFGMPKMLKNTEAKQLQAVGLDPRMGRGR